MKLAIARWAIKHSLKISRSRVYLLNQCVVASVGFHEGMDVLRAYSIFERPETVELVLKCNMKFKKDRNHQILRGSIGFPHSFGKQQRVLVFAEENLVKAALDAGADIAGGKELIERVQKGEEQYDFCLSTPSMLPDVKKLESILRAKMPAVRRGTVVDEFTAPINRLRSSVEYRSDKDGYIVSQVGTLEFSNNHVLDNVQSLVGDVMKASNNISQSDFIESLSLSSTYGPGIQIDAKEIISACI